MVKKYLPITLVIAGVVLLVIMMTDIQHQRNEGLSIMKLSIILKAVCSILLMTFGLSMLMKHL